MSPTIESDPIQQSSSQAQTGKKKNNKKKKNANKSKSAVEIDDDGAGAPRLDTGADLPGPDPPKTAAAEQSNAPEDPARSAEPEANGHATTNGHTEQISDTTAKLEAMSQEREALRQEVEQLRKQLESIQETHDQDTSQLKSDLKESEAAKEHAEAQYETLLGRVEKIKGTLGERLKRDRDELGKAQDRIDELEAQNEELQKGSDSYTDEITRLQEEMQEQLRELSTLRSRNNLSQQNWLKEKDDMARQLQHLKSELESTSNAMGEWEVIAMEERSVREGLADKVADLEEQLAIVGEAYGKAASERDSQAQAIDGLQRALQEIQGTRKKELRDMVESYEEQLQDLRKRAQDAESRAAEAESAKETLARELERTVAFEKETREKNLQIGKLRHEAIVLNDHLTRALKYIKKTKPEESIDRQIVTNHLLQFLSLDRSDPKKFQILQVIAGLLNWTDEQREQAGLARPGTTSSTLRLPSSPFQRTPSSPALTTDFISETSATPGKETLADLWRGFLERSVEEAGGASGSRKGSTSSASPSMADTRPDTRG